MSGWHWPDAWAGPGSPGDVSVQCLDTAASLPNAAWDALLGPGDFYLSSTWLRLAEEIRPLPTLYFTAGSPPVAGLVAHLVDAEQAPSAMTRVDRVLARVLGMGDVDHGLAKLLPNLVCGGLLTSHSRLPVDQRLPAATRAALTADMLTTAEATAQRLGARSLAAIMVDVTDVVLTAALDAAGYRSFPNGECAVLDVRWSSFDDYLDSLGSHRRSAVRREIRALERAGATISSVPLSIDVVPDLARLELDLLRRYRSAREPATVERSLRLLAEGLGGTAVVTLARLEGQPCGFLLLLPWRDELHARNVGFDHAAQGKLRPPIANPGDAVQEGRIDDAGGEDQAARVHPMRRGAEVVPDGGDAPVLDGEAPRPRRGAQAVDDARVVDH